MRENWTELTLKDVCSEVRDRVANPKEAGVDRYIGLEHLQSDRHSIADHGDPRSVQSSKTVFRAGDVLFGKLRPYLRKSALAPWPGVASTDILVFRADEERLLPGYLALLLQSDSAFRHAEATSAGTRMPRTSSAAMAALPILLPPIAGQRRIVDLISSIDQAIAEALGQSNAAARALEGFMEALLLQDGPDEKLGDLVDMRSGPSWKAADESTEPVEGAVPVIKITNTRPNGELDLTERVFVEDLPESTRRLNLGSLLMIRTNGNRDRIGNVYRVTPEAVDHAYSAFQIGIFPKDAAFSDYLYWVIRSPAVQNAITDAASGTTGLGNIALSWLRELPVPWPDEEQRLRVVRVLDSVEEVQSNALNNAQKLKAARTAILSELLSGKRTMPDSYDRFLEEAS